MCCSQDIQIHSFLSKFLLSFQQDWLSFSVIGISPLPQDFVHLAIHFLLCRILILFPFTLHHSSQHFLSPPPPSPCSPPLLAGPVTSNRLSCFFKIQSLSWKPTFNYLILPSLQSHNPFSMSLWLIMELSSPIGSYLFLYRLRYLLLTRYDNSGVLVFKCRGRGMLVVSTLPTASWFTRI